MGRCRLRQALLLGVLILMAGCSHAKWEAVHDYVVRLGTPILHPACSECEATPECMTCSPCEWPFCSAFAWFRTPSCCGCLLEDTPCENGPYLGDQSPGAMPPPEPPTAPWEIRNSAPLPLAPESETPREPIKTMPRLRSPPAPAPEVLSPQPLPRPPELKTPPAPGAETPAEGRPQLSVRKSGPAQRYVGKTVEHVIEVRNSGVGPAHGVQLVDYLPPELAADELGDGARIRGRDVHWDLGSIPADDFRQVVLKTRATRIAPEVINRVTVTSADGAEATATARLQVIGMAALRLELFDLQDPVLEGDDVEFLVRVTNQGTLPAHALGIQVTVPPEVRPMAGTRMPKEITHGPMMIFPVFDLQPGGSRTQRLKFQAVTAGDARLKVSLHGLELSESVEEEESTTIYSGK